MVNPWLPHGYLVVTSWVISWLPRCGYLVLRPAEVGAVRLVAAVATVVVSVTDQSPLTTAPVSAPELVRRAVTVLWRGAGAAGQVRSG